MLQTDSVITVTDTPQHVTIIIISTRGECGFVRAVCWGFWWVKSQAVECADADWGTGWVPWSLSLPPRYQSYIYVRVSLCYLNDLGHSWWLTSKCRRAARMSVLWPWPLLSTLDQGFHYPVFPAPSCTLSVMTPAEACPRPWKAYLRRSDQTLRYASGPCLTHSSEDGEDKE